MKVWSDSLKEYARGITGGLIFSLPLFYTMEMWWTAQSIPPYRLLAYILVTFFLLMGYNRHAGLHAGASWTEIWTDSVEEIGLGLLLSLIVLQSLGQLDWHPLNLNETTGKIIVQAMPVAIGISIGTAQLGTRVSSGGSNSSASGQNRIRDDSVSGRFILALCGSVVLAGNIAPTEEVEIIAVNSTVTSLIALIAESLLLGAVILFFSDFRGTVPARKPNIIRTILLHTIPAYLASLCASVLMLWFFGQLNGAGLFTAISSVIVLALPAMLGASAGRLLIKPNP